MSGLVKLKTITQKSDNAIDELRLRHSVIYRLSVASFADSDDNGIGDLRGVIDHLDYIASLGVDVVQLVGISKLPDTDGVDVGDVEAIDSLENVLDNSLLQLAVAAKRRNLHLLPDFISDNKAVLRVPSHISRSRQLQQFVGSMINTADNITMIDDIGRPRLVAGYGRPTLTSEIVKMLAVLQLTMPGVPCIYQGQELGMIDDGLIQWGYSEDSDAYAASVDMQDDDATSNLNFYRQMIGLRKSSLILQDGATQIVAERKGIARYLRVYGNEAIMVVVNLSHRPATPKMPLMGDLIASSYMGRTNFDDRELQPYEAIIAKIWLFNLWLLS